MRKKSLPIQFGEINRAKIEYFAQEWSCSLSATVQRMVKEWRDPLSKPIEQTTFIDPIKVSEPEYTQTFREWLYKHLKRDTLLGDLARDAKRDYKWTEDSVESLEDRLRFTGCTEARNVFKRAKKSYLKSQEKLAQTQ